MCVCVCVCVCVCGKVLRYQFLRVKSFIPLSYLRWTDKSRSSQFLFFLFSGWLSVLSSSSSSVCTSSLLNKQSKPQSYNSDTFFCPRSSTNLNCNYNSRLEIWNLIPKRNHWKKKSKYKVAELQRFWSWYTTVRKSYYWLINDYSRQFTRKDVCRWRSVSVKLLL